MAQRHSVKRYSEISKERFVERWKQRNSLLHQLGVNMAMRRQNPNIGGIVDVITNPLYDQMTVGQGAVFPTTVLFQTQLGQGGKTLSQTDMTAAGQLPNPQRFTIHSICAVIANNTVPSDMYNLTQNVTLSLNVQTKPFAYGPLITFPAARGYQTFGAALGTTANLTEIFSTSNGSVDPRAAYLLDAPITIEQGEQFSVTLTNQSGFSLGANTLYPPGVGTVITIFLDGNLERGVN